MNDKINIIKTTCNNFPVGLIIPIPARVIAEVCNVSESYVKKLRSGKREDNSEKAQKVIKAEILASEVTHMAIAEVQKTLNDK